MPPYNTRNDSSDNMSGMIQKVKPSVAFVVIIFGALIAFEIFNFSTTERALADLLGNLAFLGLPWSTVLALAFCGIDFAGIARLFTPEQGMNEPKEVWYLFVAWLLAATMNAILTWWGVSMAVITHQVQSSALIDQGTLVTIIPIFVAVMVWVIRILIIGTLSLTMDRIMHPGMEQHIPLEKVMPANHATMGQSYDQSPRHIPTSIGNGSYSNTNARPSSQRPMPRAANSRPGVTRATPPAPETEDEDLFSDQPTNRSRGEPSYHSLSGLAAKPSNPGGSTGAGEPTGSGRRRMS